MDKHGDFFPDDPQDMDELLDSLAQRAAAAQRMLNSMTPEQRQELMELSQQAFGSPQLMEQLARMDANLQALRPGEDWSGSESFEGDQGMGLGDGTGALQDLAQLDALADQLAQSHHGARMDDVDLDALAGQLGPDAAVAAKTLQELERALRDSGYLKRGSDGELRLSPKAMRQLGKALLRDVAERMSGRSGARETRTTGLAGEPSGATRRWEFGATEPWDVPRTITNAVLRDGGASPVRIQVDDIEVVETEARTQAAVALLVDTSFSMAMDGRWVPMKRTALALHQLVRSRFRGDDIQLIAFGRHAQVMEIEELTALDARWDKGTNLHHGLLLANRFFRKHPNAQPVLLVVTDGEPTAHLEPDGEVWFSYPPHPLTIAHSVRELDAAARLGAQVTFFRLGEDPGLARFIDSMARRVDGRMVSPELDDLGAAVVGSYLGSRGPGVVVPRALRRLVRRRPGVLGLRSGAGQREPAASSIRSSSAPMCSMTAWSALAGRTITVKSTIRPVGVPRDHVDAGHVEAADLGAELQHGRVVAEPLALVGQRRPEHGEGGGEVADDGVAALPAACAPPGCGRPRPRR